MIDVERTTRPRLENGLKRKKHWKAKAIQDGSHEQLLQVDVKNLLKKVRPDGRTHGDAEENDSDTLPSPPQRFSEVEVRITAISSTGDGLGMSDDTDWIYVVPFSVPGDLVLAKVIRYVEQDGYLLADFIKVLRPSTLRDDSRIKCRYFSKCSGCQFQMLSYDYQLSHKKAVVEQAYKNFSNLPPELIPAVGETIGSPLQYGYRTKLTPHFDGPIGSRRKGGRGAMAEFEEVPPIGFMMKGTRRTMDIEDCPIGTEAVNRGLRAERMRITEELHTYRRGATVLLRETSEIFEEQHPKVVEPDNLCPSSPGDPAEDLTAVSNTAEDLIEDGVVTTEHGHTVRKSCITDNNALSTEYVDDFIFTNTAGAFFQNNNSILPRFTAYIRDNILQNSSSKTGAQYLIDAYCGSGLFTITLSSLFKASVGIDISEPSIIAARNNAIANGIQNATFLAADATAIFKDVKFEANDTVVVIDPPRKGCDMPFLKQLLNYGPLKVVYVSCNVHTQARDVGVLVAGNETCRYGLASLRGFDFFPQTGHVESVSILERLEVKQATT